MITTKPLTARQFQDALLSLRDEAAAVVYGFSPAGNFTQVWYDQWRSAVISSYGHALEELGLHPYFIDSASFARQATDGSMPTLLCAFNLNAGITPIHHWAMVPSVASWCGIKPFPAEADVLIVGERKDTASLIAKDSGLAVPKSYHLEQLAVLNPTQALIIKPRDLGGSVGLRRVMAGDLVSDNSVGPSDIIQEFINGFDLTVPVVWQPTLGRHRCVAGVMYFPETGAGDWCHSTETKRSGLGYSKKIVPIPPSLENQLSHFAKRIELGPYARIDLRIHGEVGDGININWPKVRAFFIEVNPLPTLRTGINFLNVVASDIFRSEFRSEIEELTKLLRVPPSDHAIVLACALATLVD